MGIIKPVFFIRCICLIQDLERRSMETSSISKYEIVIIGDASKLTLGISGPCLELSPDLVVTSGGHS